MTYKRKKALHWQAFLLLNLSADKISTKNSQKSTTSLWRNLRSHRQTTIPKIFRNRPKIQACVHNAKQIVAISEEYSGLWKFLRTHTIEQLVEKLNGDFRQFRYTNSYAFLGNVAMDIMKPDIKVHSVLFGQGLSALLTKTACRPKEIDSLLKWRTKQWNEFFL